VYERPRRARRGRPHPAHSARRVTGPLRSAGRRQPSSRDLPRLRTHGRRRLCRRRRALPEGGRHQGYEIDEAEVIYWGRCPKCTTNPHIRSEQAEASELGERRGAEGPHARRRKGCAGAQPSGVLGEEATTWTARARTRFQAARTRARRTATGGRISELKVCT